MYLALPDSPGRFQQDFTCPAVLKNNFHSCINMFRVRGFHPLWRSFPETSTTRYATNLLLSDKNEIILQHHLCNGWYLSPHRHFPKEILMDFTQVVWAVPFSLAATLGIIVILFSIRYWDVSLPWVPALYLYIQYSATGHSPSWVSPFGHPRVKGCLGPNRGLSHPATSFIGTFCRAILHILFECSPLTVYVRTSQSAHF